MRVLFAGGGTGGHLVPGLNIAGALMDQNSDSSVLFLTGGRSVEWVLFQERSHPFQKISSLKKLSWRNPWNLVVQGGQCLYFLRQFNPQISVGLGSSSSVVPLLSARIQGVPFILVEQNVLPGKATSFLSRWAHMIACQWKETLSYVKGGAGRAVFTGPPLQPCVKGVQKEEASARLGLSCGKATLMVMGGSQGAHAINRILLNNLSQLKVLRNQCQVIHLTGFQDAGILERGYRKAGIEARVAPFDHEMVQLYAASDLIVCRGGGTTLAEVTACGLPAVIIPYPWHKDRHQYKNAEVLVKRGSALMGEQSEFTPEVFRKKVLDLLLDPRRREAMSRACCGVFPLDGTERILTGIKNTI